MATDDVKVNRGAEKLRRLLQRKDLTQADLSERADIHQTSLSRYSTGKEIPGLAAFVRLKRVAARLGVSLTPEDFVGTGGSRSKEERA